MSEETIESRITLLEKSERRFRDIEDDLYDAYKDYLRHSRNINAIKNSIIAIAIMLCLCVAPLAVLQCWKLWNGYGVVVIEMNGTAKCNQCNQEGNTRNGK